jgi:membrane-bound lytic murein transglycosylase D
MADRRGFVPTDRRSAFPADRRAFLPVVVWLLAGCRALPWSGVEPQVAPLPVAGGSTAAVNGASPLPDATGQTAEGNSGRLAGPVNRPTGTDRTATTDSTDDVVRTAVNVFGATRADVPGDSAAPDEPAWDIDVQSFETHDRVAYYVALFTDRGRERFVQRLSRGTRYDAMIRAKLRAGGLPEDLTFLALVESGYDPHAYSRAAAVGMWQFMSSTARALGLRVDWWMDERRDPSRSTDGAVRYLNELQRQFGSLYLATAAYNGGPGRIARGLTRFADELDGRDGEDRFFALAEQNYLRAETKNYVPQIIAAALVGKFPQRYGLAVDSQPLYAYDSVDVAPGAALATIAMVTGLDGSTLRELNPAILRGITPPDARSWMRVPAGRGPSAQAALDTVPADLLQGYRTVSAPAKVVTLATLASRYDVTAGQLRWFNPGLKTSRKGRLVAGQSIRIPNRDALTFARDLPDPAIERYASSAGRGVSGTRAIHVVRRGETIGGIARRYWLSEARLKAMNGLRGSRILAGQTLVVRGGRSGTAIAGRATAGTTGAGKATAGKAKKPTAGKAKKPTAKKPTAGKAKKPTAKKPPAKKPPAKKPTTKKPAPKKPARSATGGGR